MQWKQVLQALIFATTLLGDALGATLTSSVECEVQSYAGVGPGKPTSLVSQAGTTACAAFGHSDDGADLFSAQARAEVSTYPLVLQGFDGYFGISGMVTAFGASTLSASLDTRVSLSADLTASIQTQGILRDGYAVVYSLESGGPHDGIVSTSIKLGALTLENENGDPRPHIVPITLGSPFALDALISAGCSGSYNGNDLCANRLSAGMSFKLFEADMVTPVAFSEAPLASPEPSTIVLLATLAWLPFRRDR